MSFLCILFLHKENKVMNIKINVNSPNVGIHIRRGDMLLQRRLREGFEAMPSSYFRHAMDYFTSRHERVLFYVASIDMEWTRTWVRGDHVIYTEQTFDRDFAILMSCDHVITSIGTFSWWVGWLTKGTTIYYGVTPAEGTKAASAYRPDKIYPPDSKYQNWRPVI